MSVAEAVEEYADERKGLRGGGGVWRFIYGDLLGRTVVEVVESGKEGQGLSGDLGFETWGVEEIC